MHWASGRDDLIFDKNTLGKDELLEEITLELDGCSKEQLLTLRQILSSSKKRFRNIWNGKIISRGRR